MPLNWIAVKKDERTDDAEDARKGGMRPAVKGPSSLYSDANIVFADSHDDVKWTEHSAWPTELPQHRCT